MKRLFLTALLTSQFAFSAFADFFERRTFKPEQGLISSYIYSTTQDAQGFLWMGTENGVFKYDGKDFTQYLDKDSLPDTYTTVYFNKYDGLMYFGQSKGGVIKSDSKNFEQISETKSTAFGINSICISTDQTMWFLTQNKGLLSKKAGSDELVAHSLPELDGLIAYSMGTFNNFLFIGTSDGLFKVDVSTGSPEFSGTIETLDYVTVLSVQPRRFATGFWVGTQGDGLYMLNVSGDRTGKFKDYCVKSKILPNESIVAIAETEDKDIWLGTKFNGLYKVNFNYDNSLPALFSHFRTKTGFSGNQIGSLLVDSEETTWAGLLGDGMVQLVEKSIHYFPLKDMLGANEINVTFQSRNLDMFFGTNQGLVRAYYASQTDSLTFETVSGILSNVEVNRMSYTQDSSVIIGTKRHGVFLANDNMEQVRQLDLNINNEVSPVRDIELDKFGNIWVSISGNGLFKLDASGNLVKQYATTTGFYHNEIYAIKADAEGNIWTGAHSSGLAVIKIDGSIDYLTKDEIFPSRDVNDIAIDSKGHIWIATYGNGLFEYDGDIFNRYWEPNGLMSNYCNSVIADLKDHIWVGHRKGLSRLDEQTKSIIQITKKDGLQELSFKTGSIARDQDHNLWIGSSKGVTLLSKPHEKFKYKKLETHINDLKLFYRPIKFSDFTDQPITSNNIPEGLEFEYNQNELTFSYIAINLRNPNQNFYQYRLVGYDAEWSPPSSNNSMTYTNLDPGFYAFEVRQSDNTVNWSEDNIYSASFEIMQPYWETWWFSSGEIGFLILLVLTTYFFSKNTSNRFLIKLMVYVSLFITFEYIHTQLEPYLEQYAGGAPIFQVLMHTILGLILFPVETLVTRFIYKRSGAMRDQKPFDPSMPE